MKPIAIGRPRRRCCIMAGIGLVLLLPGCLHSPDIEKIRYYAVIPELAVESAPPSALTLGIRPLFAKNTYGTAMAYLDDQYEVGYYARDEWAESPAPIVTRAVQDALAATGRFADVGNAADMTRPDMLLTGELRLFHENRTFTPPQAELEVRLELRQATEPGSLWAETLRDTEPMKDTTPAALAEAMTTLVERLAQRTATCVTKIPLPENEDTAKTSL